MNDEGTDTSPPAIVVEERAQIGVVRLNRPAARNPLSTPVLEELGQVVSRLCSTEHISAIVFTGSGDVFASGANIRELSQLNRDEGREFAARGQRLFRMISEARQLTIAAVNGYCMGGGLDLALACDIRCASRKAVFAHPGARLGIITGWGGTQRLPRLIGAARAFDMLLTARRVACDEAREFGLVDYVADEPVERACEVALSLTST